MNKNVRVGVVGVGKLGQHHGRIYASMEGVELVGICDRDEHRAAKCAHLYNTTPYADYEELAKKIDAVSIAVPTPMHYEVAKYFLNMGVHCLVEKPITTTLHEAEELVEAACKKDVVLQVGHIERFNAAVLELQKHVSHPRFIDVHRLGSYDPRVSSVGVVLDLMIHDLDILLFLTGSKVASIDAVGTSVFSKFEDIANVRIKFDNGCAANISASRISVKKARKIRIFQSDSYMSLDYEKQSLIMYRKKRENIESFKDIQRIKPKIHKTEPLLLELEDFIRCVRLGTAPVVGGTHARNALELALEISESIQRDLNK